MRYYYIRKGEYSGEWESSKPFYSTVLTPTEYNEIDSFFEKEKKRLILVRETSILKEIHFMLTGVMLGFGIAALLFY